MKAQGVSKLAKAYGIDQRTLKKWCKNIGIIIPKGTRLLSPKQAEIFVKEYGEP